MIAISAMVALARHTLSSLADDVVERVGTVCNGYTFGLCDASEAFTTRAAAGTSRLWTSMRYGRSGVLMADSTKQTMPPG